MKILPTLTAVLAIALIAAVPASSYGAWNTDYDKALAEAAKDNKLVLLDFTGSDWCGWCIRLDKETFSKPAFKEFAAKNLVLVEVDFPQGKNQPRSVQEQNKKLQKQYGVEGFPTLVLLNSAGKEIARNPGYLPGGPEGFIAWVQNAKK